MKMQQMGGPSSTESSTKKNGPDEQKLQEILSRTGYPLDVTVGQRKYGGPPPEAEYQNQPGPGHELFCGKIPKDVYEDELIPLFEECGKIWDLRLMIDPMTNTTRGYCFVTYCDKADAAEAVKKLDNYEIQSGKRLKCNVSIANVRLFVGNIPKSKTKEEIHEEFSKLTDSLTDVIIYNSPDNPNKKNRGFAFLEYTSHKDASVAKRRIGNGRTRVWGCDIIVDWADPLEEPDDEVMSKVKVLYVRHIHTDITEEQIKEVFEAYGKVERVKKVKDFGFVHFENRDEALKAMDALNNSTIGDSDRQIEITLAKPTSEAKQKQKQKRQEMQRMHMMGGGYGDPYYGGGGGGGMGMGMGMRGRGGAMGRGGGRFDYGGFDDFGYGGGYGFDDFGDYGYGGGYDDYSMGMSGYRGGRGRGMGPRGGMRGMGGPRGGSVGGMRGQGMRGGRGVGMRGGRGGMGRGMGGMRGGSGGMRGGGGFRGGQKRKIEPAAAGTTKKRNTTQDNWGSQPIAQQPLKNQTWF